MALRALEITAWFLLLFGLLTGCQPERTPEQKLEHILASPEFTVWLDNMHLSWSIQVEPGDSGRTVSVWRWGHPFERDRSHAMPFPGYRPLPYTSEHEALIQQIVSEAGIQENAVEFDQIRWGLEGGGETLVLDQYSQRLDSLATRLMNLGR